ncbi:glycoside hydrolase family 3 protein [Longispora sp. NPDC051575]|uniref:glycoside hydrolase family 3 protein n=1 Tax=Longispora sp. NPDC051575 TaxID=3154943 RepID=UPI003414A10E
MMSPGRPPLTRRVLLTSSLLAVAGGALAGCDTPGADAKPGKKDEPLLTDGLSDEQLVGAVLMPYAYGNDATAVSPGSAAGNQRIGGVDTPAQLLAKYHLAGLILVSATADDPTKDTNPTTNVQSPAQARKLTDGLRAATKGLPPLIGIDQEYGVVTRIKEGMALLPTGMAFGAADDAALTEAAWRMAGAELAAVGVNVDFAPSADVLGGPGNTVIGSRAYGSDPGLVGRHVAAAVKGLQHQGVAACPKHFPGHGHTDVDSHEGLPVLEQDRKTLDAQDIAPFREAISAGTWMIMSGHLDARAIDPGVPSSLSRKVLVDVLRGELGFQGVVVSDALNMKALSLPSGELAVKALVAGNDLLLMPEDFKAAYQGLLDALRSGALPKARLVEAAGRVLALRKRLAGPERPGVESVNAEEHVAVAAKAAAAAVTVLRGTCPVKVPGPLRITCSPGNEQRVAWLTEELRPWGVPVGARGTHVHLTGYGDTAADLAPDAAVTVALDTPYVLGAAKSPTLIAVFGGTRAAMKALAAVLAGKAPARGRSPVTVPGLPASSC